MRSCTAALLLLSNIVPGLAAALQPQLSFHPPTLHPARRGEQVWRINWAHPDEAEDIFEQLNSRWDIWGGRRGSWLDLRAPAHDLTQLEQLIGQRGNISLVHADVQRVLQGDSMAVEKLPDDFHGDYHNLQAIESLLSLLEADHAKFAKLIEVGTSAENRTIFGLQISQPAERSLKGRKKNKNKNKGRKVGMMIVGGSHAREWITTASTIYMAHSLLLRATHAPKKLRRLLETFEFTFIPVLNPDGYEYSWREDRLWRKNRQPVGECVGIDLNRNWGYHWSSDTYQNPCADSYPGHKAFEAMEVEALRNFISRSEHRILSLLDLHSFGQMLMFPYSWSCAKSPSHMEDLIEAAYGGIRAASTAQGLTWEVGRVCEVSYASSGQMLDWAYGTAKIKWSFAANLRDSGVHGFLLPASQIRPAGEETLAMMLAIAEFVRVKEVS